MILLKVSFQRWVKEFCDWYLLLIIRDQYQELLPTTGVGIKTATEHKLERDQKDCVFLFENHFCSRFLTHSKGG